MADEFLQNACKPVGTDGRLIIERMNLSHAQMAAWGFDKAGVKGTDSALDIGCGGGANVRELCRRFRSVTGIDYSEVSVAKTKELNRESIEQGRCRVLLGDSASLPFEDGSFDLATAFETVYFWQELDRAFAEVCRVLKKGGTFLICNETDGHSEGDAELLEKIDGMTIYTGDQLRERLLKAGFSQVDLYSEPGEHWLCAVSRK